MGLEARFVNPAVDLQAKCWIRECIVREQAKLQYLWGE
jgi:hypothetical protein